MTRIGHQQLTQQNRTGTIRYDRTIEYLVIYNNNPVPLYIRLGSPEIPTQRNFDISVPPNYIMGISVDSNQFGFRLGDDNVTLALISGVSVIEGLIDEPPPALGGVPIQGASLATADLTNGFQTFTGGTTIGTFNLTLWGGMLITLIPDAGSGQGVIRVLTSSDNVTFNNYATYAFWPNIPVSLLLPRVGSFVQILVAATTIVGEPAISGKIDVRGTLTELTQTSYNPQSNAIVKTWNIAASGGQQFSFVTAGLPAISIAGIATAGTGAGAIVQLLVEASSDNTNWRQVTQRRQFMSTGVTLYRSFGNLDLFIRVTVFELSGSNASVGLLYLSIQSDPDTAAILNTIYQTLGDQNNPNPVGAFQDIYHELDQIRQSDGSVDTKLTTTNNLLSNIDTDTTNINTGIGTLHTDLTVTIHNDLTNINNSLTTIHGDLVTVNTSIGSTNTALSTINSHLANIESYNATMYLRGTNQSRPVTDVTPIGGAGVWTRNVGGALFNNGEYIIEIVYSVQINHTLAANINCYIGIGTSVAIGIALAIFTVYSNDLTGGANFSNGGQAKFRFDGLRVGGYVVPTNYNYIWYNMSVAGVAASSWVMG